MTDRPAVEHQEPADQPPVLDATRPCDGSMVCTCVSCIIEREHRLRTGVRPSRQPWHTPR